MRLLIIIIRCKIKISIMSCEYQLIARFEGLDKFIGGEKYEGVENEPEVSRKTLHSFKIALSPTGEILVFAKGTWLLICGSKWDPLVTSGAKVRYSPNWHGHVNCKSGEEITSVLCLPFFSQGHSTHGSADWTCIVLGFSSGYIRFYTEGMQELACSILHEERITYIKCFYLATAQEGKTQKQDNADIYVLYKTVICVVNKSQLYQTLRNKRNQLAKGALSRNNETENYSLLDFKKYSFTSQEEVNDACFLGQTVVSSFNTFDHLVTASLVGGFNSNYRASPPQTSLIITSGRRPFVGFHYTLEGTTGPVLTDVALAVASKIKNTVTSTLPDWLGFGSKKVSYSDKPKEVSQDYAERLNCRFGLCDMWRQGQSVIVSPNGSYSAVTDSLGRVTLIDNGSGVAHRMWKGCRDAQCGFLQVQEDIRKFKRDKGSTAKPQPRSGLFIVIYAPKKGLIEIFTAQNGRRVSSFKVTKFGHLLYAPGASSTNTCAGGFNLSQSQVVFISEEGFNEFSVPFHCALAEDSKISRDLHVLKKIKMLLRMESNSSNTQCLQEIKKCAAELKTDEIRLQTIESMITYRSVTLEAFKIVLKVFLETLQSRDRTEPPSKKIFAISETTLNILLFYDFLLSLNGLQPNSDDTSGTINPNSLTELLKLTQNEVDVILKVILQISEIEKTKQQPVKVAFVEKKSIKLVQFLACFDFEAYLNSLDRIEKQEKDWENPPCTLNLRSSGKERNLSFMGEVFFKGLFGCFSSFDNWKKHMEKCCLNPEDLALCLLSHWCSQHVSDNVLPEVLQFMEVLKFICLQNGPDIVAAEYNTESNWWKQLRSFLAGNPFTIRCLFAALCCRSVTIFFEQERELSSKCDKKKTAKASDGSSNNEALTLYTDWETISKDSCQWDILIMQLQDVALLNAILNLTFKTSNKLPGLPFDFEHQCVASIQANGTGRVSELVAKWLVQFGFEPSALIDPTDMEFQLGADGKEVEKGKSDLGVHTDRPKETRGDNEDSNSALMYLALLKTRFPYSLTSSSLLANMCWEYFAHWFKNVSAIDHLESAVRYLEVIPSSRIKYGVSYLSWNTYIEEKFETLAKIINRIGKVPTEKLCVQEIGLRSDQVAMFFKLISDVLVIMLCTDFDEKTDLGSNREVLWQNSSSLTSSLVFIALAQPVITADAILLPLQLSFSLLMLSRLNLKQRRLFSCLFDNVEHSSFTLSETPQPHSHHQNAKLTSSRMEFLNKCMSAAVQTIELVEYIPPVPSGEKLGEAIPRTSLKVDEYKKWVQICFQLATMWTVPPDDLRKHQICELYFSGFDRLAEEVIPSIDDTAVLASQLLVIGGKRLKYLIQDSTDLSKKLTKLSSNLSEWLQTLDLDDFTYQGSVDDIEVLMRLVAKWLPEGHSDHKLAVGVIESLLFLKIRST